MIKYVVTVIQEFVQGNLTLKNDGCSSYEEASEKAENCMSDDWEEDPHIDIFVGIVEAENEEEAVRIAEEKAPYYRHLMQAVPVDACII